jgi:ATP-dependent Clp protease protease subunit
LATTRAHVTLNAFTEREDQFVTEHCLVFAAAVNQNSANALIAYLIDLHVAGATKATIAISSPGGNVVNGIAIYNTLLAVNYEVTTYNIGNVDSIANIIFLAGRTRFSSLNATFMFHSVGFEGNSNERLEEKNLLEKLDVIKSDHNRISSIISNRSGLSTRACVNLFKKQATRNTEWAVKNGIANSVGEFKIPTHGNVKYLV